MRYMHFASRNFKELVRDPLSWIFCLGFPIVMLVLMTVINESIPPEAGMTLFQIQNLAPGIMIFVDTFIMLFASMLLSGDRTEAFLLRLYTSPMTSFDFIAGYLIPLAVLALGQAAINLITALIIGAFTGISLSISGALIAVVLSIPAILMFIGFGLLFGCVFTRNSAPGISSIIITLSGMFGGIWMDVDAIGGVLAKLCNALPFVHAVRSARYAFEGCYSDSLCESGIVLIWAAAMLILSVVIFRKKMKV